MKEFIEKLIGRLEEISVSRDNDGVINGCNMGICEDDDCLKCLKKKVISIVNELAEEYQSRVMIDEQFCWQTCVCTDRCNECSRLADGEFDYYESIGEWEEEYINTSNDASEQQQPTWQQQTMRKFERVE